MQASEPPDGDEFAGVVPPTLPALFADLKKAPGQLLDLVIYIKSKAPEVDPEAVAISVLEAAAKAQVEAVRLAHKAREFDYTSITNEAKELLPDLTQLDRPINLGNVPEEQLPLARRYHALLIKLGATLADQPRFVDTAATRLRNALAVFLHRGSPKLVFLESRLRPLDKVFEYGQERGVDKEWSHAAVLAMALGLSGYLARKVGFKRFSVLIVA